jgi:hypothetical protein
MKKNALSRSLHHRCWGIITFTIIIAFVLASCNAAAPVSNIETSATIEQEIASTSTSSPTRILVQISPTSSATAAPPTKDIRPTPSRNPPRIISKTPITSQNVTITSTPTSVTTRTPFPTFDVKQVITHTPFPPAECPVEDPNHVVNLDLTGYYEGTKEINEIILKTLDDGASINQVMKATDNQLEVTDLTGDDIPELIVKDMYHTFVFGCEKGKYKLILDYETATSAGMTSASLRKVPDMNIDGIPEIIVIFPVTFSWDAVIDVLEWDGEQFQSLIQAFLGKDSTMTSRLARGLYWYEFHSPFERERAYMNGYSYIDVYDMDNNGTKELILTDHGPAQLDALLNFGPWRGKTVIFKWDGLHFIYSSLEIKPAQYRFQAVQDADRLFLLGDYDRALDLYRNVIYKENLDWWSPEKMDNLEETYYALMDADPTPTPLTPEISDEYFKLSAYARYRIILHHLTRGWISDAEAAYRSMLKIYPEDSPGYAYVEMATILWNAFQENNNLEQACLPVTDYARSHPEILATLGDLQHGMQSHWYEPEDVCPFGQTFK